MAILRSRTPLVTLGSICLLAGSGLWASAAPPQRIRGRISSRGVYALPGNIHRIPATAHDLGPVRSSLDLPRITLHLSMTPEQQSQLKGLLAAQQMRGSQYHKWLTPQQFGQRFGANESDIGKISTWLADQGFGDIEVARGQSAISFSGTAEQVEAAFGTTLHRLVVNGTAHYANLKNPLLPRALKGVVGAIRGLNNFRPEPRALRRRAALRPRSNSGDSGEDLLSPANFAEIYDLNPVYNSGIDGTGETIAVAGQSDIQLSDIQEFRTAAGLSPNDPQVVVSGTDPGTNPGDESEADLDLEWAGAIAPNAHVIYVNSSDAFTSASYVIQNNLADILVISYGACESSIDPARVNSINAEFQQAAAQGITIVAASGDDGAADCDEGPADGTPPSAGSSGLAVDFPASSPYVTAIGGSEFNEDSGSYWEQQSGAVSSAVSYIPEIAWNDSVTDRYLAASGGGKSSLFAKPSWQAGPGVPADGQRDVPDLSFSASPDHDGYLMCSGDQASGDSSVPDCTDGFRNSDQDFDVVGGTSAGVPAFAGIVALLDQKLGARQGNVNAHLYAIASVSSDVFHDITQGDNVVNCTQGTPDCPAAPPFQYGYQAGPGYDQVTGLGSLDAYNLLREWNIGFTLAAGPQALALSHGASASANITVAPSAGFGAAVSFTCTVSSTLTNTTCAIPGTVSGSGTATVTVTSGSSAGVAPRPSYPDIEWGIAAALAAFGLLLLLWPRKRARLAAIALAALSIAAVSCGDGSGGGSGASMTLQPAAQNGTVTVTGTAGVMTQTTTLSVTVQ
ncbi:MAG: S53 family peptidase [Terriglobia bacterium]